MGEDRHHVFDETVREQRRHLFAGDGDRRAARAALTRLASRP
jgi:hypothetical protein